MSEPIDINDATTLKHLHCWIGSTDPTHVATVRMNDMAGARAGTATPSNTAWATCPVCV
jgi:hypothetical protein